MAYLFRVLNALRMRFSDLKIDVEVSFNDENADEVFEDDMMKDVESVKATAHKEDLKMCHWKSGGSTDTTSILTETFSSHRSIVGLAFLVVLNEADTPVAKEAVEVFIDKLSILEDPLSIFKKNANWRIVW